MALKRTGVELVAENAARFNADMDKANKSVSDFGRDAEKSASGVSKFGEIATGALRQVGVIAVEVGLQAAKAVAGFVGDSIGVAADYESSLNRFASVAGDAVADAGMAIEDFSDLALEMGAKTQYSAGEAADAMVELAKGGLDPATIAAGGLEGALNLAAAGELELSEAANITAKQLGVWSDQGVTAAQVADRFSQAANASTVDVDELAMGMANVGGVAKIAGLSFDETTQTLALLAPGFGSAADASTSMKTFLSRLIPTTDKATNTMVDLGLATEDGASKFYDATGSFIGMQAAAQLLQEKTAGLTEEQRLLAFQTIFGADAIRAAAMVAEAGAVGFDAMGASMNAAGTASEQAAKRNQGFSFAMESLKGSIETVQIVLGTTLLPLLTDFITNHVTPAINKVLEFAQAFGASDDKIGFLKTKIDEIIPGFGTFTEKASAVGVSIRDTLLPHITSLATTFAANLQPTSETIGRIWNDTLWPALTSVGTTIADIVVPAITSITDKIKVWYEESGGLDGILKTITEKINGFALAIESAINWIKEHTGVQAVLVGIIGSLATAYGLSTAASIAHAVATKATTIATAAMTAAQGLLNVALTANPIGLVIIALAGLAIGLKYAYDNSETMRESIRQAGLDFQRGIKVVEEWAAGVRKRFDEVVADFKRGWERIKTNITETWDTIKTTVSDKMDEIVTFFTELPDRITKALGDIAAIGRGIVDGIKAGISGAWDTFMGWIDDQIAKIPQAIRDFLGIGSPSKVMAEKVGVPIVQGIKAGVEKEAPLLEKTLTDVGETSTEALRSYFQAVLEDGDYLNDWLTHLSGPVAEGAKALGILMDAGGETAEALNNYFQAIMEDGDYLNDWLTHLPESMRADVLAMGKQVAAAGQEAGGALADGFVGGYVSKEPLLVNAIKEPPLLAVKELYRDIKQPSWDVGVLSGSEITGGLLSQKPLLEGAATEVMTSGLAAAEQAVKVQGAGVVGAMKQVIREYNSALDAIRSPNFSTGRPTTQPGTGDAPGASAPSVDWTNPTSSVIYPPATPSQQAQVDAINTTVNNNYNYAPTYGAAANNPSRDFYIMQALSR